MLYLTVLSDKEEARFRFEEAKRYYEEWGASAKVQLLEKAYDPEFSATVASEIVCGSNTMVSWLQSNE